MFGILDYRAHKLYWFANPLMTVASIVFGVLIARLDG
jgi:hypothetical protein